MHLRNAPTKLMKNLGHGEGYRYAHDEPDGVAKGECYFPDGMKPQAFYQPVPRGLEIKIGDRVAQLRGMSLEALAEATTRNACEALPKLAPLLV